MHNNESFILRFHLTVDMYIGLKRQRTLMRMIELIFQAYLRRSYWREIIDQEFSCSNFYAESNLLTTLIRYHVSFSHNQIYVMHPMQHLEPSSLSSTITSSI